MTDTRLVTLKESDMLNASVVAISQEQMRLIKDTVAQGATDQELSLFVFDCKRQGVHPLDRLVHFSVRTQRSTGRRTYTPITSIDFMRMRAADTGELAGNDDPAHEFKDGEETIPHKTSVTVHRLDKNGVARPYKASAKWSEYYPGDGNEGFMWRKMPQLMLGKCAEALALRKAFPKQLHGLYERAEMMQAGTEDAREPEKPKAPRLSPIAGMAESRPASATSVAPSSPGDSGHSSTDPEAHLEESELNFPTPEEQERLALIKRIQIAGAKLTKTQRGLLKQTFLGDAEADITKADVSALNALATHVEQSAAK